MPRIDDLSVSVVEALKRLPDVVEVELKVQVEKPPQRIVHLRDWHFINRDAFGIDAQNSSEDELILGGSHDLSESVRQHVGCEYIQITTKRFKEFGD